MTDGEKQKKSGFRSFFKRGGHNKGNKKVDDHQTVVKETSAGQKTVNTTTVVPNNAKAASTIISQPTTPKEVVKKTVEASSAGTPVVNEKPSWLMRTKYFQRLSNWAFDVVDTDGSGEVDEKELYSGLLLIHLKLGSMAGPAACKPVERERVNEIFLKRDLDHSGSLDREEFMVVMGVLCGNIFTRVLAQWSLTLMIVPMVAQYFLDAVCLVFGTAGDILNEWDHYEALEEFVAEQVAILSEAIVTVMPRQVLFACSKMTDSVYWIIDVVPDSIWTTVPVTLITCVLSCIAVPFIILSIDDYFQSLADHKKGKSKDDDRVEL